MDLQLKGKKALVTGASSGIGLGTAKVLAAEGAEVALVARRKDRLEEVAKQIMDAGGLRPGLIVADLYEEDAHKVVHAAAIKGLGHVDMLVNAAGGSRPCPVDAPDELWMESLMLNFVQIRRLTHEFLAGMRERKYGRIVNITGTGEPRAANAAAPAKSAVHAWAKGISREIAADGVTINSIPPGRIMSEQVRERLHPTEESRAAFAKENIPAGYFGEPEDIANLAAFLSSPLARYITGTVIYVDGGMRRFAH
ncbi:MAG: SDR family oxidoreductase [Acetobacterales bacterium]